MQLESGKYYRDADGCKWLCVTRNPLALCYGDQWICVSNVGRVVLYSDGGLANNWDRNCNLVSEWAAPATQPARPPLDLSKPIVHAGSGIKPSSVKLDGCGIKYYLSPSEWYTCDIYGYGISGIVLRQAVAKPWTQADVPFPWPVFRRKNCHSTQCGVVLTEPDIIRIRSAGDVTYDTLAKDWEHTTDGKTWKECCKWE